MINSFFAGNKYLAGSGAGPALNFKPLDPAIMELDQSIAVVDKPAEIVREETLRTFLHVVPGTPGSNLGAGLFTAKT